MMAFLLSLLAFLTLAIRTNFGLHGAFYGEGLVLTTVMRLLSGELLYRDIFTVYPPGIFLLEWLAWKCLGASLLADRIVSLIAQAALSGVLYATCRRMMSPFFSSLAFLAALASLDRATLFGYPTIPALVFVFLCLNRICAFLENRSPLTLFGSGCLAGLVCLFRHDLALYLLVTFLVLMIFHRVIADSFLFLIGFVLTVSPWVGYFVWKGALDDLISNLFLYANPTYPNARALLFPPFNRAGMIHYVPLFVAGVGFLYLLPLFKRRREVKPADRLFVSLLLFHSVSLINFFNRPDRPHLVAPLILSCPLFFFLMERWEKAWRTSRRGPFLVRIAAVVLTLVFLFRPMSQKFHFLLVERRAKNVYPYTLERLFGIYDRDPAGKALEEAVRFVVRNTEKNERIFVGLPRYDAEACDLLFYFLSDRLPAVKYQELGERGLLTSAEGQQAIIRDLQGNGVRWIVIHAFPEWEIRYRYPLKGATLLDDYIQEAYTPVQAFPPYTLLLRKKD